MEPFSGVVPLFPLPNVVLFPRTLLPLHVFEPRYRSLMRSALEGEKLIGMALLKAGWEKDYYGNPPIHEVLGVGRILEHVELPDGKFNLVLQGIARARIVEVVTDEPFRTARVELLGEGESPPEEAERRRRALLDRFGDALKPLVPADADLPLPLLVDVLASMLVRDAASRQRLLETLDAVERCERLLACLPEKRMPPRPSMN